MKRQAEKQLGKDDEEEPQENPGQGFKKAAESVLATRQIRSLPKRAGGASASTGRGPEDSTPKTVPTLLTSNPLGEASLKPDATSTTGVKSTTSFFGFNSPPTDLAGKTSGPTANNFFSMSSTSPFMSTKPQPAATTPTSFSNGGSPASTTPNLFASGASPASNTSKTFASLLSNTGSPSGTTPTAFKPLIPTTSLSASTTNDSSESLLVKYYTDLRGLNMSLLSSISKGVESDPFINLSSLLENYQSLRSKIQKEYDESSTSAKSKPTESSSSKLTPPVPPTSFAGFGAPKRPTSPATSNGPKPTIFDFKPASSSSADNPFAAAKDAQPASSSVFGTSAFPAAAPTTSPSTFSFGSSSKLGTGTSPFGAFGAAAPSTTPSIFGSPSTITFGASTNKPAASTNIFGGADKTPSPFQTAPKDVPKSVFGDTTSETKVTTNSSETTEEKSAEGGNVEGETAGTSEADPATANLFAAGSNPHDEEGEGEENEETSHSIKAKAYRLTKAVEEGGSKWVTLGAGILRLKKDKETSARRVLLRNSTNGKVIMNFNIYSGLKPTQTKAAISFVGHDAGVSQTYSLRLANEEDAKQLKTALEREIEFVKAKEGS